MSNLRAENINSLTKRYLQLHPNNATSDGSYSFAAGLPLIRFDIAATALPTLLDGKELRLTGKYTCSQGDGTNITSNGTYFSDGFTGPVYAGIDTITIASKRLNQNLERINMVNRLIPSIISSGNNAKRIDTHLSVGGKHKSTIPLTRHQLSSYNEVNQHGNRVAAAANRTGVDFSVPIYAGIFHSGEDIDLSSISGVGGLTIEILLRSNVVGAPFGDDANTNNASYRFSDLTLTVPVYEMGGAPAQSRQSQVNQFNFNSWSSMFQTINSSASVLAFTPGLSRVSSTIMNFLTANQLGDQRFNSCRLGPIGELRQLRFSKNGALLPLQYRLQTVEKQNNNATELPNSSNSTQIKSLRVTVNRNALEGVRTDRYNKVNNTAISYRGWSAGSVDIAQNTGDSGITPCGAFTQGILYDAYGPGQDFSNMVWSCEFNVSATNQLSAGINATQGAVAPVTNSLDGTATTAQSVTIYFLNKNTLMFNAQGIDVQR